MLWTFWWIWFQAAFRQAAHSVSVVCLWYNSQDFVFLNLLSYWASQNNIKCVCLCSCIVSVNRKFSIHEVRFIFTFNILIAHSWLNQYSSPWEENCIWATPDLDYHFCSCSIINLILLGCCSKLLEYDLLQMPDRKYFDVSNIRQVN